MHYPRHYTFDVLCESVRGKRFTMKILVYLCDIEAVEQVPNAKKGVKRDRCIIHHKNNKVLTVMTPFNVASELVTNAWRSKSNIEIKGFRR
jgi:hypothetical protein